MPETVGTLDGLRDIIHPLAPVQTDYFLPFIIIICVTIGVFIYFLYTRYQHRRLSRARRNFQRLNHYSSTWSANQCGDAVMAILRLYSGAHNVQRQHFPGLDMGEWAVLIEDCNRLRFSTESVSKEVLPGLMKQIEAILWPRR